MNSQIGQLARYSRARQIIATGLVWLILAATVPGGPLAYREAFVVGSPLPGRVFAALPAAIPGTEEPQPPAAAEPAPTADDEEEARKWGEITVGQPKIWQYERVNSLLDGLLRDIEGVSLADLTSLNPNATNGAAVKFVQSMLEIGVKYDQGAAATNAIAMQNYRATQGVANEQLQANSAYLQTLYQERQDLTTQLLAATQLNSTLQTRVATTTDTGDALTALKNQAAAANSTMTGLQQQLTAVNTQISTVSGSLQLPPPPNLSSTSAAGTAPESANTFSAFLGGLPSGIQQNLVNQLQSPSYPATKQLDSFITLLYERLAREISVLQDDLMRNPDNVPFLVQFDVGLYPSSRAKNHVGVVEFSMNCDGCKVYSVYPGQSSYNLANYEGASKRYSFWGNLLTLVGLGISADYRRQTDTLHGDLVQSVYLSGFQDESQVNGKNGVKQRFGWYYGASPFETLVTPGIRSTFAIVTVPRRQLTECGFTPEKVNCTDIARLTGTSSQKIIAMKIHVTADWVRRDNPFYQKPHSLLPKEYAGRAGKSGFYKIYEVALPGTESLAIVPPVVLMEPERLHVLGLEYNPVYYAPEKVPAAGSPPPPSPGTVAASASGTGAGSTTITVSGSGIASASSSGTSSTTANVSAASSSATPDKSSQADPLTGCKPSQCGTILLKLAEPIDPNMVVTVSGQPLRRVRDWRGRATSILPPAQSASDFGLAAAPASGATSAQPTRFENPPSRSLLEADQFSPNSWMEVDSHRLLLNISKDLVGSSDFPTISIVDPAKRALFIPVDLDEGFTEIVTNGFHLPSRDSHVLTGFMCKHLTGNPQELCTEEKIGKYEGPSLRPTGPYAYESFLPLFLPQRDTEDVYAYLGETGEQILIGFNRDSLGPSAPNEKKHTWLSSRVQVILEDRMLDFAWALSCYPQGAQLVCDAPWKEIQKAYGIVKTICATESCPSVSDWPKDFPSISTLQLWVEQYDPEGKGNAFHTPIPARLGRFPVQPPGAKDGDLLPDVGFSPWHFESADYNSVIVTGCRYPMFPPFGATVKVLGQHIPDDFRAQVLMKGSQDDCFFFAVPTVALAQKEIVIEYAPVNPPFDLPTPQSKIPYTSKIDPCKSSDKPCRPESLQAAQFRPYFEEPLIFPHRRAGETFSIESWTVEMPTGRVDCNDSIDDEDVAKSMSAKWRMGSTDLQQLRVEVLPSGCPGSPDWKTSSKSGQMRLVLEVTKDALFRSLSEQRLLHIIRGPNRYAIATLPDIRSLLLPNTLTVVQTGKTQFALQGPKAEVIDAVSLQGPAGTIGPLKAAIGAGIALFTIPQASLPRPDSKNKNAITLSPVSGNAVKITGMDFGAEKGNGKVMVGEQELSPICWNNTSVVVRVPPALKSGKVNVQPAAGPSMLSQASLNRNNAASGGSAPDCDSPVPTAGTYTVLPLISSTRNEYLPITVVDSKGNPLTYVLPDQKSDPASPKAVDGPTTTLTITKKTSTTPSTNPATDSGIGATRR